MAIAKVQTTDRNVNQLQQNIVPIVNQLSNHPFASGQILTSIALVIGDNMVTHKLGRALIGWFAVRFHGASSTLYDNQDNAVSLGVNTSQVLVLNSSAVVTVDLFVF